MDMLDLAADGSNVKSVDTAFAPRVDDTKEMKMEMLFSRFGMGGNTETAVESVTVQGTDALLPSDIHTARKYAMSAVIKSNFDGIVTEYRYAEESSYSDALKIFTFMLLEEKLVRITGGGYKPRSDPLNWYKTETERKPVDFHALTTYANFEGTPGVSENADFSFFAEDANKLDYPMDGYSVILEGRANPKFSEFNLFSTENGGSPKNLQLTSIRDSNNVAFFLPTITTSNVGRRVRFVDNSDAIDRKSSITFVLVARNVLAMYDGPVTGDDKPTHSAITGYFPTDYNFFKTWTVDVDDFTFYIFDSVSPRPSRCSRSRWRRRRTR